MERENNCLATNLTKTQGDQLYYVLQKLDPNQHTRIIRGDFHQGDDRFVELSRNKQYLAVSTVALCFSIIIKNPAEWKTVDINNILIIADAQYHASYKKLKRERKVPQNKHLRISELYPYIKINRNYFRFNEMDASVENHVLNLENLVTSLTRFFEQNQYGVFSCNVYSFAIIRHSNSFFLLNPQASSYAGEPMNPQDPYSAACLMETFSMMCLANHLLVACNEGHIIYDDIEYEPNMYSLIKLSVEKVVFGQERSKRQKIKRDLCTSSSMKLQFEKQKSKLVGSQEMPINDGTKTFTTELKTNKTTTKIQIRLNQDEIQNGIHGRSFDIDESTKANDVDQSIGTCIYKMPIGRGMINVGNSCFFNACFQAFFHIPIINATFGKTKERKCTCVTCSMINIFKDIHSSESHLPYYPWKLYQIMRRDNENLLNGEQQDAKDFWMSIITPMENEKYSSTMFFFAHDLITLVNCDYCHKISQTERKILVHIIDVHGRLSIQHAVEDYFAEEVLQIYNCEVCNRRNVNKSKKKNLLKNVPVILCLMLNRLGQNEKKIEHYIRINERLKMSNFLLPNKTNYITYRLVSTINHIGTNISKGHNTATVCTPSHVLYEFDDSCVRNIDSVNGSNAYILIYELSTKKQAENYNGSTYDYDYSIEAYYENDENRNSVHESLSNSSFDFDDWIEINYGEYR